MREQLQYLADRLAAQSRKGCFYSYTLTLIHNLLDKDESEWTTEDRVWITGIFRLHDDLMRWYEVNS